MELTELVANEATVHVPVDKGETVKVIYKPSEITQDIFVLMAQGYDWEQDEGDKGGIVGVIPKVVKWWDLTISGENVTVTDENVRKIPLEFLRKTIKEILADSRDDEGEADEDSSDG